MDRRAYGIAFAAALASACAPSATAADPPVLRIAMTAEPSSLSPLFALDDYTNTVDRLVFDVLITVAPDGRTLIPRLASTVPSVRNGGISRDGRTITYRLRRTVRWHDGAPFTSSDVAFSYAAIMNPANNVPNRHGYDEIASVATPDPYTVVFRMKRPYAPALTTLFSDAEPSPILPAHLLATYPNLNQIDFNQHPVGTGPYKVVHWNRGDAVELEANDAYYLGAPKIRRISVRVVPDENTLVNQLRAHEVDVFAEASVNGYGQVRALPGIAIALTPMHGAGNVLINTRRPPLNDVRVRRAIAAAIDKDAIARNFTYGAGTPATEDLPSFMWAYDRNVRAEGYDPARARALLREAGWRGPTLTFAYAQNNAGSRLIAVQIQAYLRAAGIDVQLKGYTTQMMFGAYAAGGVYQSGNFDLAWYTMTLGIDPDASGRFTCGAIPPNGQNYSRYCDHAMDAAQAAGLGTFDAAARKRAYARSQELLARDVPVVFVYWPKDTQAYDARLHGFRPNPVVSTWNAHEWSW
ncbi:MAG TPA: ABC transporter substrate-binding protein [Candidatus Elarobacter sp.]|jgi:peptide/nickel transport system substrate-binding protein